MSHDAKNHVALNLDFSALEFRMNHMQYRTYGVYMETDLYGVHLYPPHGTISTKPPTSNPTRTPVKDKRTYIPCPENQEITIRRQLKSVARWGV